MRPSEPTRFPFDRPCPNELFSRVRVLPRRASRTELLRHSPADLTMDSACGGERDYFSVIALRTV